MVSFLVKHLFELFRRNGCDTLEVCAAVGAGSGSVEAHRLAFGALLGVVCHSHGGLYGFGGCRGS